jgi:hypothetical protein
VTGFRGSERDFSERRRQEKHISRLTRVLKMLSGVNSAMVRIRQRREILAEACRLATSVGGYASAMVASSSRARAPRGPRLVGQRRQPGRPTDHVQHRGSARLKIERHRPRVAHRRSAGLQRPAALEMVSRRAPRSWTPGFAASSRIPCWSTARRSAR